LLGGVAPRIADSGPERNRRRRKRHWGRGCASLGHKANWPHDSRTKGSRFGFTVRSPRQLRHQMIGNPIAKSPQKRKLTGDWLVPCVLFYALPSGKAQTREPAFTSYPSTLKPMGLLW